jgi:hypothetical protein
MIMALLDNIGKQFLRTAGGVVNQSVAGMVGNVIRGATQGTPLVPGATPPLPGVPQYSIAINGQTSGPFGFQQLAQLAQTGQLTPQTMVWKQGMAEWAAAGTVPELASVFAPSAPPPPPPVQ